jgi:hypothetical protein
MPILLATWTTTPLDATLPETSLEINGLYSSGTSIASLGYGWRRHYEDIVAAWAAGSQVNGNA